MRRKESIKLRTLAARINSNIGRQGSNSIEGTPMKTHSAENLNEISNWKLRAEARIGFRNRKSRRSVVFTEQSRKEKTAESNAQGTNPIDTITIEIAVSSRQSSPAGNQSIRLANPRITRDGRPRSSNPN